MGIRQGSDEAVLCIVEVTRVGEVQSVQCLLLNCFGVGMGWFHDMSFKRATACLKQAA